MKYAHLVLTIPLLLASCQPSFTRLEPAPASTASPTPQETDFAIIGYLPDYREVDPSWGESLTDIIYFSAEPRPDGSLDTSRLREDIFQSLQALKAQHGTRIHLSVGGWERSSGFPAMSADPAVRRTFLTELLAFARAHHLDGLDFDWEFPKNEAELQNYISLLSEAQQISARHGMIVSVALSPDLKASLQAYSVVDRIHIMSYDRGAQHATFQQAVEDLNTFLEAGLPREKLALGVPFYGRNHTPPYKVLAYSEIIQRYHPPMQSDEADGIYFNGIATIQQKTCFALDEKIAGIMIWELGQDSPDNASLLRAIHRTATSGCNQP